MKQRIGYFLQHRVHRLIHLIIREAQDMQSPDFEKLLANCIFFSQTFVNRAVHLYD